MTTWNYAGSGDTTYPRGVLMRLDYNNRADNLYEYDAHGRLEKVSHLDYGDTVFDGRISIECK